MSTIAAYRWLLSNGALSRLLFGEFVSSIGDWLYLVALLVVVYQATEDPVILGVVGLALDGAEQLVGHLGPARRQDVIDRSLRQGATERRLGRSRQRPVDRLGREEEPGGRRRAARRHHRLERAPLPQRDHGAPRRHGLQRLDAQPRRVRVDQEHGEPVVVVAFAAAGQHGVEAREARVRIHLPPELSLVKAHEIGHQVERKLKETYPGLRDVIVHVEPHEHDPAM